MDYNNQNIKEKRKELPFKENSIAVLPVVRIAEFGAFLSAGTGIRMMIFFYIMGNKQHL